MDTVTVITSIAAVFGIAFGVFSWIRSRDKNTGEKEREIAELKIRLELYKEELDGLKSRVDSIDDKLMSKMDELSAKMERVLIELAKYQKDE